jgi:hypothetical protein
VRVSGIEGVLDMMRYDNCVPFDEAEAGKLARIARDHAKPEDRTVVFRRFALDAKATPTAERWSSFNCEVLSWEPY